MADEQAPEHPAHAYMRLSAKLEEKNHRYAELMHGWRVPIERHALSKALSALHWDVAHYEESAPALKALRLVVHADGKDLGALDALDLPALEALATPSPFGRGEETLYDEAVRKGTEVTAAKIGLAPEGRAAMEDVARNIGQTLFPGQPVKLVFYKLAIYDEDGHFVKHRDTTHGDAHHGTLLLGCHPSGAPAYKGGAFVLYLDGQETEYMLRPETWLAFYTDVEHSVDEVKDGVRMTLQFDIFLEDETVDRPHTVACVPEQKPIPEAASGETGEDSNKRDADGKNTEEDDDEDDKEEYFNDDEQAIRSLLVNPFPGDGYGYGKREPRPRRAEVDTFVQEVVALLKRALPSDAPPPTKKSRADEDSIPETPRTVAFLLQHLYRQQSLRPEFLKGIDHTTYRALLAKEPTLKIMLLPVYVQLFILNGGDESNWRQHVVIAHPRAAELKCAVPSPVAFIRRFEAGAGLIEHAPGAEYTGNEPLEDKYKYLAGAMFISLP